MLYFSNFIVILIRLFYEGNIYRYVFEKKLFKNVLLCLLNRGLVFMC